jgi:hypothetical protein
MEGSQLKKEDAIMESVGDAFRFLFAAKDQPGVRK